ncbi:MAG TPA: phosphoribosyl-ATP diphosphatase, partial [Bacillota bacterium]|nr:phosphoribosyl-ATP diphosphatase [Bacillota bacterium]
KAEQAGAACHTGNRSCFYRSLWKAEGSEEAVNIGDVVERLYGKVEDRRKNPVEGSYTCYLFNKGIDKICKKIGEESTEVVIAAKNESKEEAVYEISDLIYHLTVLMDYMDITYEKIGAELLKRAR